MHVQMTRSEWMTHYREARKIGRLRRSALPALPDMNRALSPYETVDLDAVKAAARYKSGHVMTFDPLTIPAMKGINRVTGKTV